MVLQLYLNKTGYLSLIVETLSVNYSLHICCISGVAVAKVWEDAGELGLPVNYLP
jgi:hypothetical protein